MFVRDKRQTTDSSEQVYAKEVGGAAEEWRILDVLRRSKSRFDTARVSRVAVIVIKTNTVR